METLTSVIQLFLNKKTSLISKPKRNQSKKWQRKPPRRIKKPKKLGHY